MNSKGILNELRKEMDEIKQKPLNKPEVCTMSWNEKYQLDNTILCLQEENTKLKKIIDTWMDKIKIRPELDCVYTYAKFSHDEFEDIAKYLDEKVEGEV